MNAVSKSISRLAVAFAAAGLLLACDGGTDGGKGAQPATTPAPGAARPDPAAPADDGLVQVYDRGLDFLLSKQADGVWEVQGQKDPGYTSLCVTALLERPGGVRESDRPVVDSALAFIHGSLSPDDGGVAGAPFPNYMTSAALGALAASGDEAYRPAMDKAADYLRTFQFLDEEDESYGGIGYGSDKTRSDLSNTQYALASLRAAGIGPDDPVFQRAIVFLSRTQNRKENETPGEPTEWKDRTEGGTVVRANDGGANYRPGDSKAGTDERPDGKRVLRSYGSMTYALLRCYHLAGLAPEDGRIQAAVKWLSANWTLDENAGMPDDQKLQGLYYYYMTMGKALGAAGIDTLQHGGVGVDWRKELAAKLEAMQREDGSWVNDKAPRWMEGDPVLATSHALSALAACAD